MDKGFMMFGFDVLQWVYLGLILNFASVIISIVLNIIIVVVLLKSNPNNALQLGKYAEEMKETTSYGFLGILNYVIPYYSLYRFIVYIFCMVYYFRGTAESFIKVANTTTKYNLGLKYNK